jgi:hypothetical protein
MADCVILVMRLGKVEGARILDGDDDWPAKVSLPVTTGRQRRIALSGIVDEHGRPVLVAQIAELLMGRKRVDLVPEAIE